MLLPDIRAKHARANHCSVKNELGRTAPDSESFIHPDPYLYYHTRFFQRVIWTNVLEETIGPDKFSSALPTGPMVFDNSGHWTTRVEIRYHYIQHLIQY